MGLVKQGSINKNEASPRELKQFSDHLWASGQGVLSWM